MLVAWSPFDPWHLLVLGMVALLLFGRRLPEVGRSLGKGIMEFKKGLRDVSDEMNRDEDKDERPRRKLRPPEDEHEDEPDDEDERPRKRRPADADADPVVEKRD